jgi:hypothetical protein
VKEESASFLKKRSKKLLQIETLGVKPARFSLAEVFLLLFFSKKEALASSRSP